MRSTEVRYSGKTVASFALPHQSHVAASCRVHYKLIDTNHRYPALCPMVMQDNLITAGRQGHHLGGLHIPWGLTWRGNY